MTKTDREMLERNAELELDIDNTTNKENTMTEAATNTDANQNERERILGLIEALSAQKRAITPRAILKNFFEMRSLLKALGYTDETFKTMDSAFYQIDPLTQTALVDMEKAPTQRADRVLSRFEKFHASANEMEALEGRSRLVIEISSTMTADFYDLFTTAMYSLWQARKEDGTSKKKSLTPNRVHSSSLSQQVAIVPADGSGVQMMTEIADAMRKSKHDKIEIRFCNKNIFLRKSEHLAFLEPKLKQGIANIPYFTRDADGQLRRYLRGEEVTS